LRDIAARGSSFQNRPCEVMLEGLGQKIFLLASARRLPRLAGIGSVVVVGFKDVTERHGHEAEREVLLAELQELNADLERRVTERTFELNAANTRLQDISRRIVEAQEAERRSLARELHDEVGQQLTGLSLLLNRVENEPAEQTPQTLAESRRIVGDLLARVRQMSGDLRPQVLDDLGLLVALKWHIQTYTQQTNINVNFISRPIDETRLSPEVKITAFRVVQEGLTNVARHAGARRASVRMLQRHGRLEIDIRDTGQGFDPAALNSGSGISGMRERVVLAGGTFAVESAPGDGTQLSIRLPMTPT
jgi:signal transduction histidine kinase